jgi:methionyl-tRNA formyltransferase
VTTFLIDEAIDSGALLMKESVTIQPEDNFESLHNKLLEIGAPLLGKTLMQLSNRSIEAKKQE